MPYLFFDEPGATCCSLLGLRRQPIKQNSDWGRQTRRRRPSSSVIRPKFLRSNRCKTVGKEESGNESNKDFTHLSLRRTNQKGAVCVNDCAHPERDQMRVCGTIRLLNG